MRKILLLALSFLAVSATAVYFCVKHKNTKQVAISVLQESTENNTDWYASITDNIISSEYEIKQKSSHNFYAINRNSGLRFHFSPEGFSAEPRKYEDWKIAFTLNNISSENSELNISSFESDTSNGDLFYSNKNLSVQYQNQPGGMRQNFIIHEKPQQAENILVTMNIETELEKELSQNTLIFKNHQAEVFKYSDLKAFDNDGKVLASSMQLNNNLLTLEVSVKDASFPILIDPLSTTPSWQVESNQIGAHMGFSSSTAGDVNNDGYDDVIVGCLTYDNGEFDEGRAFVYLGSATGLSTTAIWQYESDNISALFGKGVAGAGDINGDGYDDIIVGAGDYSGPEELEGKAYMFYGNSTGVNATPAWTYESNQIGGALGYPVETLGDVNADGYADIIVGCNSYDNPEIDEGVAYVFYGSAAGLNTTPDLTLDEDNDNCRLGHAVSTAGDVNGDGFDDAIIGGYNCSSGLAANAGGCFLYYGSSTGLNPTAVWSVFGDQTDSYFGFWAHGVGDVNNDGYDDIMVGAKRYDNPENDEGRAWLYLGSASGLSTVPAWDMESNNEEAEYANQFSGAGDVNKDGYDDVIMGAHFYTNTQNKEGSAYVYLGGPGGLATSPYWTIYGGAAQVNLGWSTDGAGDVNNDGYDDIIVGIFKYADGQSEEGAALAFYGSSDCAAITSYSFTGSTSTTATASWLPSAGASLYKLTAKGAGETHLYMTTSTSYTMTGLTPGKKYKSFVQGKCGTSWSPRSNVATITLPLKQGVTDKSTLSAYPNPASDFIYFDAISIAGLNAQVTIYNTNGEVITSFYYDKTDEANSLSLDISNLAPALYFYSIVSIEQSLTGSFIKQ